MYDYLIIGGGISGLYICYQLLKNNPKLNICIIEQSGRWGGRIYTKYKDGLSFESGAGRFHSSHLNLLNLIKEFNLSNKLVPLSKNVSYFLKNQWIYNDNHLMKLYNSSFKSLNDIWQFIIDNPPNDYSLTLLEHCKSIGLSNSEVNCLKDTYGYYTEFSKFNAINAIDLIKMDIQDGKYYVLGGGLSQIINKLVEHCEKFNVIMSLNTNCTSININQKICEISHNNKKSIINFNKCFITIPISNLNNLSITPSITWPKLLKPVPYRLCRIYAKYPTSWFKDMPKIITDKKITMIIPIDPKNGLIMISYSDNIRADFWNSFDNINDIKKELANQLKTIFPNLDIPNPEWISHEFWYEGCHYWPKNADDFKIMNNVQSQLGNDIYLVNEAYCHKQCWVEGSLKMANQFLIKGGSITKYTKADVAKHTTNETGIWTIIDNKVYDITKWVPQHPGGRPAIMQIAGKDGSDLFYNNPFHKGHNTEQILKKYFIGMLS